MLVKLVLFLFQISLAPLVIAETDRLDTGRGALAAFKEFSYDPRSGLEPLALPKISFVGAVKPSSAHVATPKPIIGLASSKL